MTRPPEPEPRVSPEGVALGKLLLDAARDQLARETPEQKRAREAAANIAKAQRAVDGLREMATEP